MTDDLTAFIDARLDEDEATALAAFAYSGGRWAEDGERQGYVLFYADTDEPFEYSVEWPERARHIVAHQPERVLREITAKRAILAAFRTEREHGFGGSGFTEGLEFALRHTAAAWTDHPDYREEWRPQ